MPLCFRMPGEYFSDEYDEHRGSWDAVGICTSIVLTIKARSNSFMTLATVWPGRYQVIDETDRIILKQECQGGWSVTHRFYAPGADRDFYWQIYDNPQTHTLLRNCIWPLNMALRLSEWYGTKCHQLLGIHENQLYYVTNGAISGTVPEDSKDGKYN